MPVQITVPDTSNGAISLDVEGKVINVEFRFMTRTLSWVVNFLDINNEYILSGCKLQPNLLLTSRYSFENFVEGDFICGRVAKTDQPLGRDNFGNGKDYGFFYFSRDEIVRFDL